MEYKRLGELPYIERKPTGFLGKCPTIIFLHGAGSRGTDLRILGQNSLFGKNSCIGAEDSPFVIFAPLCIRNTWFDVFEQFSRSRTVSRIFDLRASEILLKRSFFVSLPIIIPPNVFYGIIIYLKVYTVK